MAIRARGGKTHGLSEFFHVRSQIKLVRPGIAWLLVKHPIRVSNMIGIEDAVLVFEGIPFRKRIADKSSINSSIDNTVCDMDTLRP